MKCYRSCYMTDIQWSDKIITLTDSNRNRYLLILMKMLRMRHFRIGLIMFFSKEFRRR